MPWPIRLCGRNAMNSARIFRRHINRPHKHALLKIETNVISGEIDLAALSDDVVVLPGGGLGRRLSIYRLPEADWSCRATLDHPVEYGGGADLPVYIRVTQADGNQAWTSPIYLVS